ncbi:MAG: DUF1015 family protein [Acetobacter sp.]|nr:DUF1015 family protein [Bacteroides sp.]MCM1341735.1 DUF1015 family protein [Acetobacter sp.]MCM1432326.1 DUF1015 family protein [Clostridiales bacterium]
MAVFRGFKAYRPCKENQELIPALPYDVMSSAEARTMVKDKPLSFLHVDRAEVDLPEDTDIYSDEVYKKAKSNLDKLEADYMIQDNTPCFYIYNQIMNGRGQVGIVGCASIDDYINNVIKKHEHTLAKKEQDRINHVNTCDANTGPIFLTYRNNSKLNDIVDSYMKNNEPEYDFIADGVKQTVWVVSDSKLVAEISELFGSVDAMYIADGHHRCASAVKVGQMRREQNPDYTGEEEFNYFLAVAFPDNQLEIMDYNRVVKDLNGYTADEFLKKLEKAFTYKKADSAYKPSEKHTFGMLLDNQWYELRAKKEYVYENSPVDRLDVSILQNNLLTPVLNISNPKNDERIDFIGGIRGLEELERRVNTDMTLAFAMYPTTVEDLMDIADAGLIMPPKSTWFEPKLLSGIFIHHLS